MTGLKTNGSEFWRGLWKEIENPYHAKEKGQICNPEDADNLRIFFSPK